MWKNRKKIIVGIESAEVMGKMAEIPQISMIEEETMTSYSSLAPSIVSTPCRTPMGGYIVPKGRKPLTSQGDSYPGPADYLPKVDITKRGVPNCCVVGKPKRTDEKRHIPGPFNYNTSGDAIWKGKTITLKGRGRSYFDVEADKSTGLLGNYNVEEHLAVGKNGPKFQMGIRADSNVYSGPANNLVHPVDTKGFHTPGPNYRPNSSYWGRGPKKSFGDNWKSKYSEGPGPGDYDVQATHRGPSHSFGIKLPEPPAVQQSVNKFSPGANTYNIGTTIGKSTSVFIAERPKETRRVPQLPGPTTYDPEFKCYNDKYKATAMTYRWYEMDEAKKPGPTDYNVKHGHLKKNPSYTFRQRVKTSYPDSVTYDKVADDNPGPGSYKTTQEFDRNGKPAFSLRKKLDPPIDKERFPGPNAYIPEQRDKPGSKKSPSYSLAKRVAYPNSMKDYPGPAEYLPSEKLYQSDKGKYTMTSRPKGKGTFVNPAPNLYTLPELISGKKKGVALKSRASPYVYSGFRSNKIEEPRSLPVLAK